MIFLEKENHTLGSRILLRSAIETLALLIYSNQKMESIVSTSQGFHEFSDTTSRLLLGSRNNSTELSSINILTALQKCEKRYEGIMKLYEDLSESSHPNWEGVCLTYTKTDRENFITYFENRWLEKFGNSQIDIIKTLMVIFETEYNDIWTKNFESFEIWIQENDDMLEASK
ncbi:MAG: hypothetical protein COA71_05460 [SAR86 cluster bacterium]|uniref:Uncharacterized protein n=1 Tax=SAR86 cluster bacterium TaxID=2030880 RepID=A0A2A5CF06_9GAMM|nr:MAG: hypothetical protein COA71_05460 [SAR86 cluster bacterium]